MASRKPRKTSKRTEIKGDVHIKDGDLVAGDKTIVHGDADPGADKPVKNKRASRAKSRDIDGSLDVRGGDVVFGDKVIKFFQDTLNIYVFKDVKQLALFLGFLLVVAGSLAGAYWYSKQPKPMSGNYNIAIAQFGEIQADGTIKPSAAAEQISSSLFNFLDTEYRVSGLGLDVQMSHKNMPLILEDSQAKELAQKVNADIVIYGNVFVQNNKAEFSPRFYVAEHPDTSELTGQDELAHPILFNISELSESHSVNAQLRKRTEILFNFTKALIYFSQKDTDSAFRAIQIAITAAEKLEQPFAGQEVLYLIAAKLYLAKDDYEHAAQMFENALLLNPEYARAHLGRGNMYYTRATLPGQYDPGLMDAAQTEFELALRAPVQPEGAYIPIKAHTGLGNVFVVMAQANGNDPALFAEAIEHYQSIIDTYLQTEDSILRSDSAIAYFGMGAAYERQNMREQAIEAYSQAYDLAEDEGFKKRITEQIEAIKSSTS
jgi:tetratricopeptide (TPR) repeat protein